MSAGMGGILGRGAVEESREERVHSTQIKMPQQGLAPTHYLPNHTAKVHCFLEEKNDIGRAGLSRRDCWLDSGS